MTSKLTLNVDKELVKKVRTFAKKHDTSLSKLIEDYLLFLSNFENEVEPDTPILSEILGILENTKKTPEELINEYKEYLRAKYLLIQ